RHAPEVSCHPAASVRKFRRATPGAAIPIFHVCRLYCRQFRFPEEPMRSPGWRLVAAAAILLIGSLQSVAVRAADPAGSGPEPARVLSEASLPTHTVYRPANLTGRYPVVLWGNGSCVNSNFGYREFLAEVASHDFIMLAIGPYRDSPTPRQPQ